MRELMLKPTAVWLDWWSEANEVEANKNVGMYMGVYAFLCIFGVAAIAISCWSVSRLDLFYTSDML